MKCADAVAAARRERAEEREDGVMLSALSELAVRTRSLATLSQLCLSRKGVKRQQVVIDRETKLPRNSGRSRESERGLTTTAVVCFCCTVVDIRDQRVQSPDCRDQDGNSGDYTRNTTPALPRSKFHLLKGEYQRSSDPPEIQSKALTYNGDSVWFSGAQYKVLSSEMITNTSVKSCPSNPHKSRPPLPLPSPDTIHKAQQRISNKTLINANNQTFPDDAKMNRKSREGMETRVLDFSLDLDEWTARRLLSRQQEVGSDVTRDSLTSSRE
ncbi:hypothetical protein JOB18_038951 [Solea senegalensis]|uniref:Uncharacterized protein n=1 Tax=Solea senegalensis TaxID=28829 RepID=A0AAV6Q596_SOLSE|nr:hypothetical protein JOB18_038951 [Solea senegalensis]